MLIDIGNITANESLEDIVETLIAQGHEGAFWDFKKVWHENKVELVHDIACMANNLESNTSYIICGIDEEAEYATVNVREHGENRKNTQQLNNLLWSKPWAFGAPIVEVIELKMPDGYIDVIVVYAKEESQPYYLTKAIKEQGKEILAGAIYTRVKDSNTPMNETASLQDTETLWKRHFGISLTPLERLPLLLSQHEAWVETQPHPAYDIEAFSETFYHKEHPEFTFMKIPDDDRDGWEYYMLVCPFNRTPKWYLTRFYYHNTLLTEDLGVYIDHHFFPVPEFGAIPGISDGAYFDRKYYYYYMKDSLNDRLEQFCLNRESVGSDASHRFVMKVIPRYQSEVEKTEFEKYLAENPEMIHKAKDSVDVYIGEPETAPDGYREDYLEILKEQAEYGAALVSLLNDYRYRPLKRPTDENDDLSVGEDGGN